MLLRKLTESKQNLKINAFHMKVHTKMANVWQTARLQVKEGNKRKPHGNLHAEKCIRRLRCQVMEFRLQIVKLQQQLMKVQQSKIFTPDTSLSENFNAAKKMTETCSYAFEAAKK